MKTLVIYYSLEGNTKLIAENLSKEIDADILELKVKKEYPKGSVKKYIWGVKSIVLSEKPELIEIDVDIAEYDRLFIGSPIWGGNFAPPINSFIKKYKLENKKIALFTCHAGGGPKKSYSNLKNKIPNNDFIGEIDFDDPIKKDTENILIKVREWAKSLK